MIRINLLPHREEKRKAKRQQFFALAGMIVVLAGLIVFLVHTVIDGMIEAQSQKNNFLKTEIAGLDKKIDQIKRLREQTQALLSRKKIIEALQEDRSEAVRLLSELSLQVPEGIYLKSMKQEGGKVSIAGYAQSNSRVSQLMRNVEASQWIERPELGEIKAATVDKKRVSEFTLSFSMKRRTEKTEAGAQVAKGGV